MASLTLLRLKQLITNDQQIDEEQLIHKIQEIIDSPNPLANPNEQTASLADVISRNKDEILAPLKEVLHTGWKNFDDLLGGLHLGEFNVLGGRPGMGKTQLLTNLAIHVSKEHPVLYVSLDLSESLLCSRIISAMFKIDLQRLLTGRLSEQEKQRIDDEFGTIKRQKLFLYNGTIDSMHAFQKYCREQIQKNGIQLIIIDYLQLMGSKRYRFNRELEIGYISRTMKAISRDYRVCVLASSQLSRSVEQRGGEKRPILSDLRESGAIEQDADKVFFLYRPEYYGFNCDEDGQITRGRMDIILAKNRCGPLATLRMKTDLRFSEIISENDTDDIFSLGENRLSEIYNNKNEDIDLF